MKLRSYTKAANIQKEKKNGKKENKSKLQDVEGRNTAMKKRYFTSVPFFPINCDLHSYRWNNN